VSPRVLHLVWRLTEGGGVPRVVRQLLLSPASPPEAHLLSIRPFYPEDRLDTLPKSVRLASLEVDAPRARSLRSRIDIVHRAGHHLRQVRPDLIHLHQGLHWYALESLVRGRVPVLLDVHDAPSRMKGSRVGRAISGWMARHLPFTLVVHSAAVREEVAREWGVDRDRIAVVPLGIPTQDFAGDPTPEWRQAEGISPSAPLVTYVARLVESKNIPLFLAVAERVLAERPDAVFLLVGQGPVGEGARQRVEAMGRGGSIRGLGFRDDLPELLRNSDVFLSTSDYEGFGLALAEAGAAGTPVVSTRVGGVTEVVVEGETGFLAEAGDAEGLAAATLRLLATPELRARMGAAGRTRVARHFDSGEMAARYQAVYARMLG